MSFRDPPKTLPKRVAAIEEQLRRFHADAAQQLIVTSYPGLSDVPTDLVHVSDLAPIAANAAAGADAAVLAYLMDDA